MRIIDPVSTPQARPTAPHPLLLRAVLMGAAGAGIAGAVVGLVVGLFVYAPTAWFAVIELGLPAAAAGAVMGLGVGSVVLALRKFDQR